MIISGRTNDNRELKEMRTRTATSVNSKNILTQLWCFLEPILALVILFVSIFAEILLPSVCLPKQKD